MLVGGSTRIPLVRELLTEKFGNDKICARINPDQAVALGAAIVAASFKNDSSVELTMLESIPLSLGYSMRDDFFNIVIQRGEMYPNMVRIVFHE